MKFRWHLLLPPHDSIKELTTEVKNTTVVVQSQSSSLQNLHQAISKEARSKAEVNVAATIVDSVVPSSTTPTTDVYPFDDDKEGEMDSEDPSLLRGSKRLMKKKRTPRLL
ncbi:hypothetical protein L6452_42296 [Arctium lappa]|uniref:Uncharacterized protein n=1 Tax=Arctium lappa TaxID=4217 RepID=A0ACB8XJ39_ARCLA|nr:hypothetical protein L6452_42296 [Arctium lappa]